MPAEPINVGDKSDEPFIGSVILLLVLEGVPAALLFGRLGCSVELLLGMCLICICYSATLTDENAGRRTER